MNRYINNPSRATARSILPAFLAPAILLSSPLHAADNEDLETKINALIAAHNFALPTSLLPTPGISDVATAVTYSTNLILKYTEPYFVQPADRDLPPNTSDMCLYEFDLPQAEYNYSNVLGFWDTFPLPSNWGVLGQPYVYHANTSATVEVRSSDINPGKKHTTQKIRLDPGTHGFQWSATSQVNHLFDTALPPVIYGFNKIKWGKLFTKLGATGENATKVAKVLDSESSQFVFNLAVNLGLTTASQFSTLGKPTVTNGGADRVQFIRVYDVLDPLIDTQTPVFQAEATDIGGAFYARFANTLEDTIIASDPCGRSYTLTNDAPVLLPLGETTLTWTVTDRGPNEMLESNTATLQQTIIVEDTQAPILVPPPGRVIETSETMLSVDEIDFGAPRVVDLADSSVSVSSDAPADFLRDSRTSVTWSATDDSGNTSMATQLVTLKEIGTNTAPSAVPVSTTTLTSVPVDIVLRGSDSDIIDGVADPLAFDIQSFPNNGGFVAPLLPFFINDYRTTPEGPWGEEFRTSNNRGNWLGENICEGRNTDLPDDFVYNPKFFQVTDDGTTYITDYYWLCRLSRTAAPERRISKWDSEGNFLGSHNLGSNRFDEFVLDRDGKLYLISTVGAGSSTDLFLTRCSTDFGARSGGEICDNGWKFSYASAPNIDNRNFIYARVDSSQGIAYVHDKRNLYLFDIRQDPTEGAIYLGKLYDGFDMFECANRDMRIDIDSEGYVYANNSCSDRIYKFDRSYFDDSDNLVMGELIGWMGRCDTSTNKACDDNAGASKGFSCTDATCTVTTTEGDGPGQFNRPAHIVIDPNDILYVADRGNARIQRFRQDGTFAGEAKSSGTGINKGDSPSFILGNFAPPAMVTVNSKQFFILDEDESFVHVFETSPLKDITDNSAVVTYVSDFDFHSNVDGFTYRVNDGLDASTEVNVSVTVNRNFRQPLAIGTELTMNEDGVLEFELEGDDPDGILGRDFNGLDTLTYDLVSGPEFGRLEGTGQSRRYTPDADFHGTDSFVFTVNDGREDSAPATVDIEVLPVNDPPELTISMPEKVGVGFPVRMTIAFTDDNPHPELETQHEVRVEWGDGAIDVNGEVNESELQGVVVVSPPVEGAEGIAIADYTYKFPDQVTLRACLTDSEGATGCDETQVTIETLVNANIDLSQIEETVAVNDNNIYTIIVENQQPDSPMSGLVAADTMLSIVLPEGMSTERVSTGFNCSVNDPEIFCELGDMESGQSDTINLETRNNGSSLFEQDSELSVMVESVTPGTQKFFAGLLQTTVEVDNTDSDGDGMTDQYEIAMGLDPDSDDSQGDLDGDGLRNGEEFSLFLSANTRDTDLDGMDDAWELAFGLDPRYLLDAGADNDGDGFSNLQEYLADRNPNVDEKSGNELLSVRAGFEDNLLTIPTVKIGKKYFDLEFTVISSDPLELRLSDYQRRRIRMAVEDNSVFDGATNLLDIPQLEYNGNDYAVVFELINLNRIDIRLVSGLPQ